MKIIINRTPDIQNTIATDEAGNSVVMYLPESAGGSQQGIRPMQMLIMGMGGCAAVDVLTILKKKRQVVEDFQIEIDATRQAGVEPSLWESAHLKFIFRGQVDPAKAAKAVEMSLLTYCSASETLRKAGANLSWEIIVNP